MPVHSALFLNCTYVSSMLGRRSPQRSTSSAYPRLSILVLSNWMDNLVGGIFCIIHSNTQGWLQGYVIGGGGRKFDQLKSVNAEV